MATIYLTQGDNQIPIDFSIFDATNTSAIDLSNTSNNLFKMALPGSMIDTTNSSTTIMSATGGVLRYTFMTADTVNAGAYTAELELYYHAGNASGRNATVPGITVLISPEEPE